MRGIRYRRGNEFEGDFEIYRSAVSGDNSGRREKMKEAVLKAMENELSDKQRQTLELYYFKEMTMQEIADELGVCRSTVSRSLSRARSRISRCVKYSL